MTGVFSSANKSQDDDAPPESFLPVADARNSESEPNSNKSLQLGKPPVRTMSISQRLLRSASGFCCESCGKASITSPLYGVKGATDKDDDDDDTIVTHKLGDYNLQALRDQGSTVSPFCLAPMTMPFSVGSTTITATRHQTIMEAIMKDYMDACRFYGGSPTPDRSFNAGILTTLRFSLPSLRASGSFHDADMLALCEILLQYGNGPLSYIKRLDFSVSSKEGKLHGRTGFRSHGALTLSKVLQQSLYIEEVLLQRHFIGPFGASALFIACTQNSTIKKLNLRRCQIGERGALVFAELIATSSQTGLVEVDLSANRIGFKGTLAVEKALLERAARPDLPELAVDMEGNLVFQEIMNGVTHGLGMMLAMVGASLLSKRVRDKSQQHVVSCAVYSTALIVLYTSSTLFHSFVTLRNVKYIFEVLDKSAIYILIAGSYTPFLQIVLAHEPRWSVHLLGFLWVLCAGGIGVEFCLPTWQHKGIFSLAMYLGMGWSALVVLPEVARTVPGSAMNLILLGGVSYTAGVPFFVRDNNLDHAVWHVFVLAGSIFHWCGIYFYVAPLPLGDTE